MELADTRALRAREAKHFVRVRPPPSAPGCIVPLYHPMEKRTHQSHTYYIHGNRPRVLIFSGMHGNEYESGLLLYTYIQLNAEKLPDFVYIPEVSPSAVAAKTRKNKYGNDINRMFIDKTSDPEAKTVMDIVRQHQFDICIDVHEDPDRTLGFYLYDTEQMTEAQLASYRTAVGKTEARLYTGIDDVDDEHLMLQVDNGYVSLGFEKSGETSGFSSRWLYEAGICRRAFTLEIPGKAGAALKNKLIPAVITFLLQMNSAA